MVVIVEQNLMQNQDMRITIVVVVAVVVVVVVDQHTHPVSLAAVLVTEEISAEPSATDIHASTSVDRSLGD